MSKSEPVEIELYVHALTEKGAMLSDDGQKSHAEWVARHHLTPRELETGRAFKISMPEWLAVNMGWA